jgi:two-component system, OmpR family, response regulator RegX3
MRAVLRRRLPPTAANPVAGGETDGRAAGVLEVGDVLIDHQRHEVHVRGEPVRLPLKEFELLSLLCENAGWVMSRSTLIDRVWGSDYVGDTKTLDVHIKRLRSKVEPDPTRPQRIVTIRGLGYKFEPSG